MVEYEVVKNAIISSQLRPQTKDFCCAVVDWLASHPDWKSPRGGVVEILRELAGRRGLLPTHIAYLFLRAGQRHCEEFRQLLAERGVRAPYVEV